MKHAKFSPSAGDRWVACLRAVPLEAKAPPEIAGEAAELGTDAHEVAALFLQNDLEQARIKAGILNEKSEEHVQAVIEYCAHINEVTARMTKDDGQRVSTLIEQKVEIYAPYCWGTADTILVGKETLFVSDFKSGSGYIVPVETWQLKAYAVGVVKFCQSKGIAIPAKIVVEIFQPRARGVEAVRQVEYDLSDLVEFEIDIRNAIDRSLAGEGGFEVGGHCRWCRAKADCPGMAAAATDLAHLRMHGGNPEAALDPQALGPAQLDEALKLATVLEPWIKALWARAERYLDLGGTLSEAKLVDKRSTRKWIDEAATILWADNLKIDAYQPAKASSPAQLEKRLTPELKIKMGELVEKVSSGMTIVHMDDKRPAANDPAKLRLASDMLAAQAGKKNQGPKS